jgi:aerobic carbon-monoxide dehydrogenase medium subunit
MKPAPFDYVAPDSVDAALDILAEQGDDAKLLAGGQSLIPAMNFRVVQPALLVDMNRLSELDYVQAAAGGLRLGALCRQRRLEQDPLVAEQAPLLREAVPFIAHSQIRNRGTLGGSLVHADPAAELPVIMTALQARFRLQNVSGDRWVNADDFFQGFFMVDMSPDEMLVEVALPPLSPGSGYAFMELARRQGDYAMMGVAVVLTLDETDACREARLVYLNAGGGPVTAVAAAQMLQGQKESAELFTAVGHAAAQEIDPLGNVHATIAYQRHLAEVLTRRALARAFGRARGEEQADG